MIDDPIFDPWCLGEESRPSPSPRASRWRSRLASSGASATHPASDRAAPSPSPTTEAVREAPLLPIAQSDPTPGPEPTSVRPGTGANVRRDLGGAAGLLRTLLIPPLVVLGQRLAMARHRTTLDDRLDQDPATVRFRIEPWLGPFDTVERVAGAVLEVVLEGPRPEVVSGRLWLDPLSTGPTEESTIPARDLSTEWIEALLVDFVEKALRQA